MPTFTATRPPLRPLATDIILPHPSRMRDFPDLIPHIERELRNALRDTGERLGTRTPPQIIQPETSWDTRYNAAGWPRQRRELVDEWNWRI